MRYTTNRCATNVFEKLDRGLNHLMQGVPAIDAFMSDDPRLSMLAFDNRYVIECDLPGVTIENVTLHSMLTKLVNLRVPPSAETRPPTVPQHSPVLQ